MVFQSPNLLIRRHRPMVRAGVTRVLLSCRWRGQRARLASSLSELSSAQHTKKRRPRFLLPESFQGALAHGRGGIVDLNVAERLALGCRNAQGDADRRR